MSETKTETRATRRELVRSAKRPDRRRQSPEILATVRELEW